MNSTYHEEACRSMATKVVKEAPKFLPIDSIVRAFEGENPERAWFWGSKQVATAKKFNSVLAQATINNLLQERRADRVIKQAMDKWRSKITAGESSHVHRLALDCALFNSGFSLQAYPYILSLEKLKEDLASLGSAPASEGSLEVNVWSLGLEQLILNNSKALINQKDIAHRRVAPVYQFVEAKADKEKKEKKSELSEKFKSAGELEQGKLVQKALLKTISYMNMFYALFHNEKGEKLPEFKSAPPALGNFLKEELPLTIRLDYVMGSKALKWAQRVRDFGENFIQEHGLGAHTFLAFPASENGLKHKEGKGKEKKKK